MRGGKRPGAGRKPSSVNRMSQKAREKAAETGLLPHEFLLAVSRGEMVGDHLPSFEDRLDAAKAAAPYYAPKLASVEQKHSGEMTVNSGVDRPPRESREEWISRRQREAGNNVGSAAGTASGSH